MEMRGRKERGGARQMRTGRTGVSRGGSGGQGYMAGDLGKAFSTPTLPVVPEDPSASSDNRWAEEECDGDFDEWHDRHHITSPKLVADAPAKEKTDAVKPVPESTEDQMPYLKNMTEDRALCPERKLEDVIPYSENVVDEKVICSENAGEKMSRSENLEKELPCPDNETGKSVVCLESKTENMSCHESVAEKEKGTTEMLEKEILDPQTMNEKQAPCWENVSKKRSVPSNSLSSPEDSSQGKNGREPSVKVDNIYQKMTCSKPSEKEGHTDEEEKVCTSVGIRLRNTATTIVQESTFCSDSQLDKKVYEEENSKTSGSKESADGKAGLSGSDEKFSIVEDVHDLAANECSFQENLVILEEKQEGLEETGHRSGLDNKLLEEVETLSIPEHLKNQVKNFVSAREPEVANVLLKDFVEFWPSVNALLSLMAKSALPVMSDQVKEVVSAFLNKAFSAKAEDSAANYVSGEWAEEKRKVAEESLMEKLSGTDQLSKKLNAINMVRALSQRNELNNATLTQIYSCFREQQPAHMEGDVLRSKELKSLLTSLNEGLKDNDSHVWASLKENGDYKDAPPHSEAEGRRESNGPFLKVFDLGCSRHLSELSVRDEHCRSPVEDSFSFSTYANSFFSRPYESSYVSRQGRDLQVILSLIQKYVRRAEYTSMKKGQGIGHPTDQQKGLDHPTKTQEDDGVQKGIQFDGDDQGGKEKHPETAEESDLSKSAVLEQTEVTGRPVNYEEVPEKADAKKAASKPASVTALADDSEVVEKSEYEELEKEQPTSVDPPASVEPVLQLHCQESVSADLNLQTSPKPATTPKAMSRRMQAKKSQGQTQLQTMNRKKQKKQKQRSAPKTQKGRQPERERKTTRKTENGQHRVTGRKQRNRSQLSRKQHKELEMSPPIQPRSLQDSSVTVERVADELVLSRNQTKDDDSDNSLRPSVRRRLKHSSNHKNPFRKRERSASKNQGPQEAGQCNVQRKTGKTSRKRRSRANNREDSRTGENSRMPTCVPKKMTGRQEACRRTPYRRDQPRAGEKDERGGLPLAWDRMDMDGGVRMKTAGDGTDGTSQGQGQGHGSSASSPSSGGNQGWGGARPKTTRNGSGGGGGGGSGDDGDGEGRRPPTRNVPDSLPLAADPGGQKVGPQRNFKRHRKKQHGAISNEQLCHCLGQAGKGMETLRMSSGVGEVNRCMRLCLHDARSVTSPSDDDLACCTCAILHSLLFHFSTAGHDEACAMCLQLFTLVRFHILDCRAGGWGQEEGGEGPEEEESRNVCRRMGQARVFAGSEAATAVTASKMWRKVRKYLSAALSPALLVDLGMENEVTAQTGGGDSTAEEASSTLLTSGEGVPSTEGGRKAPPDKDGASLQEHQSAAMMPKAAAGGKLCRRPSQRVVPQKTIPEEPVSPYPSPTAPDYPAEGEGQDQAVASGGAVSGGVAPVALPSTFPRQAETPEDGEDIMKYILSFDQRQKEQQSMPVSRNANDDPYATQKTYGLGGTVSMPERRDRLIPGGQMLSVEMHPVGTPGIGEVVYGTRMQLQLVARNWRQERDRCKASGICQYQHREEGVILHAFKRQLKILHTRYQKHHQWERLVHLGNGVTGKCHLCIDRTSNFKFCCKKVHILHYEDQELDIWSELDHPNIVRFYGAIRHGEKIYMFAEFIDGGSLAAMIKEQWLVGRRLSHWTSLNYFRQLLKVLTYLQNKGVLHEDIKADNLLLRDGTTEIVLADFGAAQQIPHDHTPPNRYPVGSPAHWSPEKAASEGHGFSSDQWASACVLIHMLSGSPPWIVRFPDAAILNYIIWSKPPPLDDLPADVKGSVRDLLTCCLVKDKAIRPTAEQILSHHAFKLLDQASSFFSIAQHAKVAAGGTPSHAAPVSVSQQAAAPQQSGPAAGAHSVQSGVAASQSVLAGLQPAREVPACQRTAPQATQPTQADRQAPQSMPLSSEASGGSQKPPGPSQTDLCGSRGSSQQSGESFHQASNQQSSDPRGQDVSPQEGASGPSQSSSPRGEQSMRPHSAGNQPSTGPGPSNSPAVETAQCGPRPPVVRVVEIPRKSAVGSAGQLPSGDGYGPQSLPASLSAKSSPSERTGQSTQGRPPVHRKSDPEAPAALRAQQAGNDVPGPAIGPQRKVGRAVLDPSGLKRGNEERNRPERKSLELKLPHQETTQRRAGASPGSVGESVFPLQPAPWPELPSPIFPLTSVPPPPSFPQFSAPAGHSQPGSQGGFPSTSPSAMVGSMLSVPGPVPATWSGGEDVAVTGSVEGRGDQAHLSSYGAGLGHGEEVGAVSQGSDLPAGRPAVGGQGSGSGGDPQCGGDQPLPLARVTLTRTTGPSLLHRVAQEEPGLPGSQPAGETNAALPTTSAPRSVPSVQVEPSTASYATPASCLLQDPGSQQGMAGTVETHLDVLQRYPVLPALSPEDFQVSSGRRGVVGSLANLLSVIPEGAEQESLSPSAPMGSSGESSGGTMWNYIQDQFTMPPGTDDQLLQSLHQPSENRPRLALYTPTAGTGPEEGREEVCRLPPMMLPRFELLHCLSSDSSTLRSSRINTSSEGSSGSSQFNPRKTPETGGSSASMYPRDEPDHAFVPAASDDAHQENSPSGVEGKHEVARASSGYSDEEHIPSADMFGAGPHGNPAVQEVFQYRNQQLQQSGPPEVSVRQPPTVQPPCSQPTAVSRSMLKKQPHLRLDVAKTAGSQSQNQSRDGQNVGMPESGSSHHGDEAFLMATGVSPMTASPQSAALSSTSTPRQAAEIRPRSRNESGSSASTPKSSTYDRQEQEWNTLQLQTPGLEDALLEDPMGASGSELSSTHHLSLLYESHGESSTPDQEENDVLSMLQDSISNDRLGGHRLVFESVEGQALFDMRVLGRNKGWKELATTFRSKIQAAGFRHFKVVQQDLSPVDYFSTYCPSITRVKVIEVSDDLEDIFSICWCNRHLPY